MRPDWAILCAVQLGLPFREPQPGPARAGRNVPTDPPAFYYVRHKRARRYLLRVDADGRVRVTIPRGGSRRQAEAFAGRSLTWIASQRARLAPPVYSPDERRALRQRAQAELP